MNTNHVCPPNFLLFRVVFLTSLLNRQITSRSTSSLRNNLHYSLPIFCFFIYLKLTYCPPPPSKGRLSSPGGCHWPIRQRGKLRRPWGGWQTHVLTLPRKAPSHESCPGFRRDDFSLPPSFYSPLPPSPKRKKVLVPCGVGGGESSFGDVTNRPIDDFVILVKVPSCGINCFATIHFEVIIKG
jgi:hypothetical protein